MKTGQRLKVAGKELMRGNFGNAIKSLTTTETLHPSSYRGGGSWFFGNDGVDHFFRYTDLDSSLTAYLKCAPLNAVISKKVKAYITGMTWILDEKGKEASSKDAVRLRNLINNPNPLQTWQEFEAQAKTYKEIFGYNVVLDLTPSGFDRTYAKSLWNIPPQYIKIEYNDDILFYNIKDKKDLIKRITFSTPNGKSSTIDKSLITIQKTTTPSFDSPLLSDSPIRSLEPQINNIIGAYESRNTLINYRGSLGILTPEIDPLGSRPLQEEDKEEIQQDFIKYGLKRGQHKFIISPAAMKWQQMGISTKELMLFEEILDDIARICDSYEYPYELISSEKGTTFANKRDASKGLYQDCIIPSSSIDYSQWNSFFNCEAYKLRIDKDYSHLPILQEDRGANATARKSLDDALSIEFDRGLITLNDWLVELGKDPIGDLGNVRATDPKNSNVPLAVTIGVGGVQGLIAVITAQGMSEEAKQAALEVVFGLSPVDASRMSTAAAPATTDNQNSNTDGNATEEEGKES